MKNKELLEMLTRCLVLKEQIKQSKSIVEKLKKMMRINKLREQIISQVDNSVLSFKELYKLLKLYEDRQNREIQFETCNVVFVEDDFEESIEVTCILIRRVYQQYQKKSKSIVIDPYYKDIKFGNEKYIKYIPSCTISNADVSLFFKQFKSSFKRDYELFAEFVISYLMYKHL